MRRELHQVHVERHGNFANCNSAPGPAASQVGVASRAGFDSVGVYLKVRHNFVTNFFGSSKQIAEHTVMRLEPQPLINCGVVAPCGPLLDPRRMWPSP